MVFSCLVEPLVAPLAGRGAGVRGTALTKSYLCSSRVMATALAATALLAIAGTAEAEELASKANQPAHAKVAPEKAAVRNAHAKPDPIPYRVLLETVFAARREDDLVAEPGLAPGFEQDALDVHRLKPRPDSVLDLGPGLGRTQRIDRLYGGTLSTYLRFGSGRHLAGQPIPA